MKEGEMIGSSRAAARYTQTGAPTQQHHRNLQWHGKAMEHGSPSQPGALQKQTVP